MSKKQCAICGSRVQSNIVLRWRRNSDMMVFHVCALCAEDHKVNEKSVQVYRTKSYSTVE